MKSTSKTEAGALLKTHLQERGVTQVDLAEKTGVSAVLVHYLAAGHRPISPQWANIISQHLKLTEDERKAFHRAAARDKGFEIDLS